MTWLVRVRVMPRAGLLDPQGGAVEHALAALGFAGVASVRIGRTVEIRLDAPDAATARERVRDMCERLIANPVTEDWTLDALEDAR